MIREDHLNEDGHFFIYGCHCILAAANQTLYRIEDAYPDGDAPGDLVMFSSEDGKCGTAEAVVDKLMESTPTKYMGMCMLIHPSRFKKRNGKDSDIMKILHRIEHRMPEITKITLYLDEFDKYNFLVKHLEPLCSFSKVVKLELVSATIKDSLLLKKYNDVPAEQLERLEMSYDQDNYVTYDEQERAGMVAKIDHPDISVVDYIVQITRLIKQMHPDNDDMYICAPCLVKRASHDELATMLQKLGITTILYNSDFKGAILPSGMRIQFDLNISKEPAELIKHYKSTYNLKNIVVTGNLCIGRAVTLQTFGLVFDYCILHHEIATSGDSLYQADRSKGNTKLYRRDRLCGLICTTKCFEILRRRERYALVAETERSMKEHIKFSDAQMKMDMYEVSELFDSKHEAYTFIKAKKRVGDISKYGLKPGNTIQYRGENIPIYTFTTKEQFITLDVFGGISKTVSDDTIVCRIMPVMNDGQVKWVCIYNKGF
jgi:hypothetical protein